MFKIIAVLAALLVACGGGSEPAVVAAPTASPTTPSPTLFVTTSAPTSTPAAVASQTLANGWTRMDVASEGFSIDVPPRWRAIVLDAQTIDATSKVMTSQNPELASVLNADVIKQALASGVKLGVFDVDQTHNVTGFANNLNILKQPLSTAMSQSAYTQANVAQIEDLLKVKTAVKHVTLGNGTPADEVSYERTVQYPQGPVTLSLRQYFVIVGQTAWVLSFTIAQQKLASYGDTILQTATSFRPR